MDFDHDNVRQAITEDRLSRLPDELIHQILSCLDTKFAIQTCLLSSRWKFIWKSMPCLNFASGQFKYLPKFSKFVTNVLSHRNHQVEVSSVKLSFRGAASQFFVRKIATYAFSHNVQNLTVTFFPKDHKEFPPCLFSSQSLKHLTLRSYHYVSCVTPKTPWDFPALTSLHLNEITLCDDDLESLDLFSKCVNLKNLILKRFKIYGVKVFDIIAPRLYTLMLIDGRNINVVNVIAPQLEHLTIINCGIKYLIAPCGLSSFYYKGFDLQKLSKNCFNSLNKVKLHFYLYLKDTPPYDEKDAQKTIKMLQELGSARFLTLNLDMVECLSSFPDLISHLPSPFGNLISLSIDSSREEPYRVKISTETKNFFLENSPTATFITNLPEDPPTKAMIAKQARDKKRAKVVADIESHMKEVQGLLESQNRLLVERKQENEKIKIVFNNLMAEQKQALAKKKMMPNELEKAEETVKMQEKVVNIITETLSLSLKQEHDNVTSINAKQLRVRSLLGKLPIRLTGELEQRYFTQLEERETESVSDIYKKLFDNLSKLHPPLQPPSSSS